jgi:hypothetical protein
LALVLRRTPDALFEGNYDSTLGYDRALAEIVSSRSTSSDVSERDDLVAFRADESTFRHISRYVGRIKLLSNSQRLFRMVGKGATLNASSPAFEFEISAETRRAIHAYDLRASKLGVGLGLGLAPMPPQLEQLVDQGSELTAYPWTRCRPIVMPVEFPDLSKGEMKLVNARVRHVPTKLSVDRFLQPLGDNVPEYLPKSAPLIQLLM